MSLRPDDRKSWHGFLDLLQPPSGYRLAAALGTTFALSVDALTAALLAMGDADGEQLSANPVAATMAITRMADRVRVLVHPGTVSGPPSNSGTNRFVALLDRLVVQVQPPTGLFHPKVWALRFEHIGAPRYDRPAAIGRVIIGSRNLNKSTAFELGVVLEGSESDGEAMPTEFGKDVSRAFRAWMTATDVRYPDAVWRLPAFVAKVAFDVPREAEDVLRLRWQGLSNEPLASNLPTRLRNALIVSPFVQPEFVTEMLHRAEGVQIVSIPQSLDALPDETIEACDTRSKAQGGPVLYQVTDHGDPDDAHIDGIHAKLLLADDGRHQTTFLGSANATAPGWGLASRTNVEAMVEMRPGIGIDQFVKAFIREAATKIHPWISEYDRSARPEPDHEAEMERQMLAALREVAKLQIVLRYQSKARRLILCRADRRRVLPAWASGDHLTFFISPFLLAGADGAWRPIAELEKGESGFDDVSIDQVSAFVAVKVRSRSLQMERQRFVVAKLELEEHLLDKRDDAVRAGIMATADPAMVLNALVRGLAHLEAGDTSPELVRLGRSASLRQLLSDSTLERLLQAVALDPNLIQEMRMLLGPLHGEPLLRLCADLDEVVGRVSEETRS